VFVSEKLEYQAQSPDEAALVGAARNFGFVFKVSYVCSCCDFHELAEVDTGFGMGGSPGKYQFGVQRQSLSTGSERQSPGLVMMYFERKQNNILLTYRCRGRLYTVMEGSRVVCLYPTSPLDSPLISYD